MSNLWSRGSDGPEILSGLRRRAAAGPPLGRSRSTVGGGGAGDDQIGILPDAALVLGLGLGIHLKQSRVCSVVLLAYGIFSCVVILLQSGRLGSWLIILAGVFAVIYTFKLEQEYRAFKGN